MAYIQRVLDLKPLLKRKSVLLLGPRQTGKSSLIHEELDVAYHYNLLQYDTFARLNSQPQMIREQLDLDKQRLKGDELVVIDEIQKIPHLMDEVHTMIEHYSVHFLLTGSSARKLKKTYTSLLGGRARLQRLLPFVSAEIFNDEHSLYQNLDAILLHGTLPSIYQSDEAVEDLRDYVGLYLQEEIMAEAYVRKIDHFSRFLSIAVQSAGQILNFEKIARDAQVPARTVIEYFELLEDTLLAHRLEPYSKTKSRKQVSKAKMYFFDNGVANALLNIKSINDNQSHYGQCFEQFVAHEIFAYKQYKQRDLELSYWQNYSGHEIDFILNDDIAIEVKSTKVVQDSHLKHLKKTDLKFRRKILVSRDKIARRVGDIDILPLYRFLTELWSGDLL